MNLLYSPLEQFEIIYTGFDLFVIKVLLYFNYYFYSDTFESLSVFSKYINEFYLINDYLLVDMHMSNFFIFNRVGVYFVLLFFLLSNLNKTIYPLTFYAFFVEKIYVVLKNIINQNFDLKFYGQIYFPLLYTIFMYILILNLLGLIPYGFTVTSFCVQTFTMSCSMLISLTILKYS